jgi:hypothetical protein
MLAHFYSRLKMTMCTHATLAGITVTVTDNLLQHELQKSLHPSPVVSRLLSRPV